MKRRGAHALFATVAMGCLALAAGASAQQPTAVAASGQQPIQVTSDKFEALRDEGRFIYTGNVEAVEGKSRMKADKLTVICDQPAKPAARTKADAANPGCNEIKQLVAESNVYYLLDDDKIHGERAEYDYGTGIVTVTAGPGGRVVLSRSDQGVISGPKLVYDTNKGVAKMSGLNAGDRVTSIFVPKDNNSSSPPSPGQSKPPAPSSPTPPAASPPAPH